MSDQATFCRALLNAELPCPEGLTAYSGYDPSARFAVYRNNVMASLIDALADTFAVLQALVGEAFFRAMARVFVQGHPPASPVLAHYGDNFARFVSSFPPAASVPYLADMARLEMARVQAYHSADVPAMAVTVLQAAMLTHEHLSSLRLVLHPSVHLIDSPFAIVSIWSAHQGVPSHGAVNPDLPEAALVFRNALDVNTLALPLSIARFVDALLAGSALAQATDAASAADPAFDLPQALAWLLRLKLITHITHGDDPHEDAH